MQSSGEFRLTEPLSTALVEAALRGDKSGVFRLIGQGSWVEQRDSMWKPRPVIGHPPVGCPSQPRPIGRYVWLVSHTGLASYT